MDWAWELVTTMEQAAECAAMLSLSDYPYASADAVWALVTGDRGHFYWLGAGPVKGDRACFCVKFTPGRDRPSIQQIGSSGPLAFCRGVVAIRDHMDTVLGWLEDKHGVELYDYETMPVSEIAGGGLLAQEMGKLINSAKLPAVTGQPVAFRLQRMTPRVGLDSA